MSSGNNGRYGLRRSGGQHGDVFTSPKVVSYMLDIVGYSADKDLSQTSILEPSCGEGEFVVEIVRRLLESSRRFGFDFSTALQSNVFAYDIDEAKIAACRSRVASLGLSALLKEISVKQISWMPTSFLSTSLWAIRLTYVMSRYRSSFFPVTSSGSILSIIERTFTSCSLKRP